MFHFYECCMYLFHSLQVLVALDRCFVATHLNVSAYRVFGRPVLLPILAFRDEALVHSSHLASPLPLNP